MSAIRRGLTVSAVAVCFAFAGTAQAAASLTDITVFSANAEGNNWLSLHWNTQGQPFDGPNRYNLYVTDTPAPGSPNFLNSHNDSRTEVSIPLTPGEYTFRLFAESVTATLPSDLHFVLNLYFNGDQAAPGISGLTGASCPAPCAASHPNGLDILGASGAPEAGTLAFADGDLTVTLTSFEWNTRGSEDVVWPHWGNDAPYADGSGTPDFIGQFTLRVSSVSEPYALPLFGLAVAGVFAGHGARRRR